MPFENDFVASSHMAVLSLLLVSGYMVRNCYLYHKEFSQSSD